MNCYKPPQKSPFVFDSQGIAISTAPEWQSSPDVAFDGTNYFVVWSDQRSGYFDIYGARIDTSGVVIDKNAIPISTNPANAQKSVSIAFDGTNYLVVWQDNRNGGFDIYGNIISKSGRLLSSKDIAISTVVKDQESPSIAFDKNNYLVVWQDNRDGSFDIYGVRINTAGKIVDKSEIKISVGDGDRKFPAVAFDDTNYFVVWQDERNGTFDIYGTRISKAGKVLDSQGIPISVATNNQRFPKISFDGTNYLVVWEDSRNDSSSIYGTYINTSGNILYKNGINISSMNGQYPSLAFDGTNYLVVWQGYRSESSDIFGTYIDKSGNIINKNNIVISFAKRDQWFPRVVFNKVNYLVVWEDERSGSSNIYGARVKK